MESRREWLTSSYLWTNHRELWAENGDALSRIYAGTGALNTSFTRSGKRTLGGVVVQQRDIADLRLFSPQDYCLMPRKAFRVPTSTISRIKTSRLQSICSWYRVTHYYDFSSAKHLTQGNLSFQRPVTIFDLIHDTVNTALAQRY